MNQHTSTLAFLCILILIGGCGKKQSNNNSGNDKFVAKTFAPNGANDAQIRAAISADSGYNIVNLNSCEDLTDESVSHIVAMLPDLRELHISSPKITDKGLSHLSQLTKLEELSITGEASTDKGFEAIQGLTALKKLSLHNPSLTAEVSQHLKALTNLEELDGDFLEVVNDVALTNLGSCTKLTKLKIGGSQATFTDEGMTHLGSMTDLEDLWIEGKHITDIGISHLKDLAKLKELVLYRTNGISDKGIQHLSKLGSLENLKILYGESRIDGPGLESLTQMKNLKTFACRKLSNDSLKYLGALQQLEELDLSECREIDNNGLQHLAKLENLKLLNIGFSKVTDEGLVHLQGMKNLETLFATSTEISEQGIQDLQTHLPKLSSW